MNTNLMDIYNNRYIPLVLFSTHSISKIIFKFNKYITFDTFIFTKLLSIISTTSIIHYVDYIFGNLLKINNKN